MLRISYVLRDYMTDKLVWSSAGHKFDLVSGKIAETCLADKRFIVFDRVSGKARQTHEACAETENAVHLDADANSGVFNDELAKLAVERNLAPRRSCFTFENTAGRIIPCKDSESGAAVQVGGEVVSL